MEKLTKNMGMLLLGIWFGAWALFMPIPAPGDFTQVLAIFAICSRYFYLF